NDVNHCKGHLESADGKLAPLRDELENTGQADPSEMAEAYQYIQVVAPHLEQHIERLKADPTRAQLARLFEQQLTELSAFHGKLRQAVRSAHRQALIAQQQEQQAGALGALD